MNVENLSEQMISKRKRSLARRATFRSSCNFAVLLLLMLAGANSSFAQKVVHSTNGPCEENSAWLDLLMQKVGEGRKTERVFVIARLGGGERSRLLNHRRLHNARTYLMNRLKPEGIVVAEGERVNGEGRVEFYLGSELMIVSLVRRGEDLCVNCFEPNPKYYGCGREDSPKRR